MKGGDTALVHSFKQFYTDPACAPTGQECVTTGQECVTGHSEVISTA